MHPDDRASLGRAWAEATERGVGFDLDLRIIRPDSEQRWVSIRAVVKLGDDGTVLRLSGTVLDNTDRVEALRMRHEAEAAFEQAGIGAAIIDLDGIPIRVNAAVCALLGRPKELLIGRDWNAYQHPDELPVEPAMRARGVNGVDTYTGERRFIQPDGSVVWAAFNGVLVRDDAGNPLYSLVQLQDITERKAFEAELAHQALHDPLTGLPNRTLLSDRLVHGLADARRRSTQLGVIYLDIDHFKDVNDLSGHAAGDRMLRHVVARISDVLRASDTLARVGGDEFVIVCSVTRLQEIQTIAQRLREALSETCMIAGQEMAVTASIGIVVSDEQSTPEGLLCDSDAAMYLAKGLGRNRVELFDDTPRAKTEDRLAIATALRHPLAAACPPDGSA